MTTFRRHLYLTLDTDPARRCACGQVTFRDYQALFHAAGAPTFSYFGMATCDPADAQKEKASEGHGDEQGRSTAKDRRRNQSGAQGDC